MANEQSGTLAEILTHMGHDYGATDCLAREGGFPLDGIHCRKCRLAAFGKRLDVELTCLQLHVQDSPNINYDELQKTVKRLRALIGESGT